LSREMQTLPVYTAFVCHQISVERPLFGPQTSPFSLQNPTGLVPREEAGWWRIYGKISFIVCYFDRTNNRQYSIIPIYTCFQLSPCFNCPPPPDRRSTSGPWRLGHPRVDRSPPQSR